MRYRIRFDAWHVSLPARPVCLAPKAIHLDYEPFRTSSTQVRLCT